MVGLGNPGSRYAFNRHNAGFRVVNVLAERLEAEELREAYKGLVQPAETGGKEIWLLRPMTYMNSSGDSVVRAATRLEVLPQQILVVTDDIDLPFGSLRLRSSGGPGGHKGLSSVIDRLGTQEFPRLRVGIGFLTGPSEDFVLEDFTEDEEIELAKILDDAAQAVLVWVHDGIDAAMNRFNRRISGENAAKDEQ